MVIFWTGIMVFTFHACSHMVAAGDTWVAMACGRHFSNHGVDTIEPFSANSHRPGPTEKELQKFPEWFRPAVKKFHPTGWINQNWGTHLMFYTLAKTFGSEGQYNYDMLIVWKFTVNILAVICIYYLGRLVGAEPFLAAVSAAFAMFVARTFIDVRPAVFSNLLAPLTVFVMSLAVYKNIKYIWLIIPVVLFWANVHGGYIYVFIMGVPFVALNLLTSIPNKRFTSTGFKGVIHSVAAFITALIAMVVFNPFHLTNITHTYEISVSKNAESWRNVNEWHPAFEWSNPVGQETAFLVMFIIIWIVIAFWFIARLFKPGLSGKRIRPESDPQLYKWPRIDLSLMAVTGLTVYMAIRSRRFIPIAAALACPVMAMMITQAIRMIGSRLSFNKDRRLIVPGRPAVLKTAIPMAAVLITLFFGCIWGAKFKRIYLDPWPDDNIRDSIFMRMTASNLKPFQACQFIRENKLSGRLFNHWTEGGAIAFGQEPDPETGKVPLKLFMDGRSQAAYDHSKFLLHNYIKGGGPINRNAMLARRKLTSGDYVKMGKWIDAQMKYFKVWLIIMPVSQIFDPRYNTFTRGLTTTKNWPVAYMDNYQYIFVDADTEKGGALINDVVNQKVKFPDEFTKNLTLGYNLLRLSDPKVQTRGFEHTKKALEIDPCRNAMINLTHAAGIGQLRQAANSYIQKYLKDFQDNKETYTKQGGYLKKLSAAIIALEHISKANPASAKEYRRIGQGYMKERSKVYNNAKW